MSNSINEILDGLIDTRIKDFVSEINLSDRKRNSNVKHVKFNDFNDQRIIQFLIKKNINITTEFESFETIYIDNISKIF